MSRAGYRPAGSIRTRLGLAMAATAIASVALAALIGAGLIRQSTSEAALAELRERARALSGRTAFLNRQPDEGLNILRRALNLSGASVYRIEVDGSVAVQRGESLVEFTADDIENLTAGRPAEGRRKTGEGEVVFVAQPVGGPRNLVLVLARPAGAAPALPVAGRLLVAAAVAGAAALAISLILSNRIAGPLHEVAAAAEDVARGDLTRRVAVGGEDEIASLARSFNQMTTELADAQGRQREFFLSVSHELRTPLTAIQGYAEAIEDGTASGKKARGSAAIIVREARRLARLVSDLLDLGRIDAKRFELSMAPVDVAAVLDQVAQSFAPQAAEAGVEISVEARDTGAMADRDRLVQILSNLVENALRYTPQRGSIRLTAVGSDSSVRIDVTDTGPGFEPEDLARAFERHYLWRKYRGRESGTGLGLAITKELADAMGGAVSASPDPGGGARFSLELPAAPSGGVFQAARTGTP